MEAHTLTRVFAFFVDIIILSILLSLLTFWIPTSEKYKKAEERQTEIQENFTKNEISSKEFIKEYFENYYDKDKETVLTSVISVVLSLGYFGTFAYYNNGQTIGKKIFRIKVTSSNEKNPSHLSFLIRTLIINSVATSMLSCIMILFINKNQYIYTIGVLQIIQSLVMFISIIMVALRNDKRGLHDFLSKTKVIQC